MEVPSEMIDALFLALKNMRDSRVYKNEMMQGGYRCAAEEALAIARSLLPHQEDEAAEAYRVKVVYVKKDNWHSLLNSAEEDILDDIEDKTVMVIPLKEALVFDYEKSVR